MCVGPNGISTLDFDGGITDWYGVESRKAVSPGSRVALPLRRRSKQASAYIAVGQGLACGRKESLSGSLL